MAVGEVVDRSLCADKMQHLIQREWKDRTTKNVDTLNLTRNSRLCFCQFNKEKTSDGYVSGYPVYFTWNNWRKPTANTVKAHICKALEEVGARPSHVTFPRTFVASVEAAFRLRDFQSQRVGGLFSDWTTSLPVISWLIVDAGCTLHYWPDWSLKLGRGGKTSRSRGVSRENKTTWVKEWISTAGSRDFLSYGEG